MTEIRETMIGLLLPSQTRVKDVITEKLDIDLIAQQAANNVLDVKAHALFIIDLMGKLCAPVRDEVIDKFFKCFYSESGVCHTYNFYGLQPILC